MATKSVAQPHAGEIGKPERRWHIVPSVLPVPLPLPEREDAPTPDEIPELEPEPEHVTVR